MKPFSPSAASGFSILEVLIALIIIGITIPYLALSSRTADVGNSRAMVQREVAQIQQEGLDRLYLMNSQELLQIMAAGDQGMEIMSRGDYRVTAVVRPVNPADVQDQQLELWNATLYKVTLKVFFPSITGEELSKTYETIRHAPS